MSVESNQKDTAVVHEKDLTVGVVAVDPRETSNPAELLQPSLPLMVLTWATFIITAYVLYKVAWKPILKALDMREESIRKALSDADKARKELETADARRAAVIADAEQQRKKTLENARITAETMVAAAAKKTMEETQVSIKRAQQEINAATENAQMALRRESAELAVEMAGRVIGEKMDVAGNSALVEKLIREL